MHEKNKILPDITAQRLWIESHFPQKQRPTQQQSAKQKQKNTKKEKKNTILGSHLNCVRDWFCVNERVAVVLSLPSNISTKKEELTIKCLLFGILFCFLKNIYINKPGSFQPPGPAN